MQIEPAVLVERTCTCGLGAVTVADVWHLQVPPGSCLWLCLLLLLLQWRLQLLRHRIYGASVSCCCALARSCHRQVLQQSMSFKNTVPC